MKQETNKEMDLLLRRLARRPDGSASNNDDLLDHLDADELNAYAENALPSTARMRYTEHLAECARCRELVVSLSGAAGVVLAPEAIKAAEPSGFRKFLGSLFSPMVLHYAAPALGLIGVAIIGLVLLSRPESNTDFVVQVPREAPAAGNAASPAPSAPGFSSYDNNNAAVDKNDAAPKQEAPRKSGEQPAPVPNAPPSVNVTAEVRQDAATGAAAQPAPQESPAAPKTADSSEAKKREEEAQKDQTAGRKTVVANEAPPQAEKKEVEISRRQVSDLPLVDAQKSRGRGIGGSVQASRPGSVQRDGTDDKDHNFVETRSVAGRRFRKEGGVWIDTAYNSARTTTTLARNSEQFRALVADEPAIQTIADQLDGEIVVVWKGRPYRIR